MFALTIWQFITWSFIAVIGVIALVLILLGFGKSRERLGGPWTSLIVLSVAVAIAAAIVFPVHHGDGRSTSYNDGWDFVAQGTAGTFDNVYKSMTCEAIYQGEASANGMSFTRGEDENEWVHGCKDARYAEWLARQEVTVPLK
jgi:hypothetical protein